MYVATCPTATVRIAGTIITIAREKERECVSEMKNVYSERESEREWERGRGRGREGGRARKRVHPQKEASSGCVATTLDARRVSYLRCRFSNCSRRFKRETACSWCWSFVKEATCLHCWVVKEAVWTRLLPASTLRLVRRLITWELPESARTYTHTLTHIDRNCYLETLTHPDQV